MCKPSFINTKRYSCHQKIAGLTGNGNPMNKLKRVFNHGESGFTLIELVIVILVLSILVTTVVISTSRFTRSGRKAAAESEFSTVQLAVYAAMIPQRLGNIAGGVISDSNGIINGSPEVDVTYYIQGGLDELKGSWTVNTNGLITDGAHPADVANGYWAYDHDEDTTWYYVE
jgi:prepilin-type N-terminal cleavage/methylation domain-containing protein